MPVFGLSKLSEPEPMPEMLIEQPDLKDDCRRPTFLLIAAVKNTATSTAVSPGEAQPELSFLVGLVSDATPKFSRSLASALDIRC